MGESSKNRSGLMVCVTLVLFILCVVAPSAWQLTGDHPDRPDDSDRPGHSLTNFRSADWSSLEGSLADSANPDAGPLEPQRQATELSLAADEPYSVELAVRASLDPSIPAEPRFSATNPVESEKSTAPLQRSTEVGSNASIDDVSTTAKTPTPLQPKLETMVVENASSWPHPASLIEQVNQLSEYVEFVDWSADVLEEIHRLSQIEAFSHAESAKVFSRLGQLVEKAELMSEEVEPLTARKELLRTRYALVRRLDIWHQVHLIVAQSRSSTASAKTSAEKMLASLDAVETKLNELRYFDHWRKFLLIDQGRAAFSEPSTSDAMRQDIARKIADRLKSPALNQRQQDYFDDPIFQQFHRHLRSWANVPIDYATILRDLEIVEEQSDKQLAHTITQYCQTLQWSDDPGIQELGRRIDAHYRNANIRFAISGQLLDRLLPEPQQITENVSDVISGADVWGVSRTTNQLRIRLVPDHSRIVLGLEAEGLVSSDTEAYKGPVVFWNEGRARYKVSKLLIMDQRGMWTKDAEAEADSDTYVKALESDFDSIPLLGSIARSIAMQQQQDLSYQTNYQVEQRIKAKVRERLDRELNDRLVNAEKNFQERILRPLLKLQLYPEPVGFRTTSQRVIARYRVAGSPHLAAHTPRPQAKSDTWLSTQIHQSALTNVIQQLELAGGTFNLRDLYRQLAALFSNEDGEDPDDLPANVTIQFADREPVQVNFEEDRIAVTLRIAMLSAGRGSRWRDFGVRVHYVPDVSSLDARFIRDPQGYLELASPRLRMRDQVVLRGIFSKVFSPSRSCSIFPKKFVQDQRLQDLEVSQFVVNDGWIGVALAPNRQSLVKAHADYEPSAENY